MSKTFDIAIVGGGIVGLATAQTLAPRLKGSLVVVEAEDRVAAHQTGHNSGVIHSGLYYKPGSLKARNCVAGREAMYRFCQEHGVPHERCGKIVVATDDSELPALAELERRGRENGLSGVRRLGPAEIRELEPHVAGIAGLHIPETGIIDYVRVTERYADIVRNSGGEVRLQSRFQKLLKDGSEWRLLTDRGEIRARNFINCGGLQADRVAHRCGVDPGLQIVPFRGEYYELIPERQSLVRNLIYPVPDSRFPFLGVHFTRMVGGGIEAGPNAVLALKREGYRWRNISLRDSLGLATYGGFWKMAFRYWRMGFSEVRRSLSKGTFVRSLQKLIPELKPEDVQPAGSGVRAQALLPDGKLHDDFHIVSAERMIHVLNAPSPAATASLSIGQSIADLAGKNFSLGD